MPIQHSLWTIASQPGELKAGALSSEQELEEMIVAAPRILSDEWMLIGKQEDTGHGGRIDLLAIAPDASLVLIELKRNRTPRDVVAQAIDYAAWVETLEASQLAAIYQRFKPQASLASDFFDFFQRPLDEDELNKAHQIVVVASQLDAGTERIVNYLGERDIAINVLYFQVFELNGQQLLSRAWLLDPLNAQVSASATSSREKEPWNGEFYASFGHDTKQRNWAEAVKYGFIAAGGGSWYSNTLDLLETGDRIWVKAPGYGFVGVGRVTGRKTSLTDFQIDGHPATEILKANYHREFSNDRQKLDYFVPVEWLKTVDIKKGIQEVGMFGNQNTICKPKTPKWRKTVERLKKFFDVEDN
jgi:hypothetical protein